VLGEAGNNFAVRRARKCLTPKTVRKPQQHTSPSHTAILVSLEPVFAALTSWLLVREHFGGRTLIGAALILAGILLAELKGPAPAVPESPEPVARAIE
jgi:drug/metabolite transporter (DMT)-like permease